MEVLISPLVLGPIPISSLSEAFQACNLKNFSLSFGVGVRFNAIALVLDVKFCFCSMAWHVIKNIIKFLKFCFQINILVPWSPFWPFSPGNNLGLNFHIGSL
jgi:hypothetical protein